MPVDASAVTGLHLGVRESWLHWITADGAVVPTPQELAAQERQRAKRAEQLLEVYRHRFGSPEEL